MSSRFRFVILPLLGLLAIPAVLFAEYQEKTAGDAAFRNGDYSTAASFYDRYRSEAELAGDLSAERDAWERRIDSLILGKTAEAAEKILQEYMLRFPGADPIAVTMWSAEIQLLKRNPESAKKSIERILPALTVDNPRRIHAVYILARAYEGIGDFTTASTLYFSVYSSAQSGKKFTEKIVGKLEITAWERGIFCLAFTRYIEDALLMIAEHPALLDESVQKRLPLLTCFLMIKGASDEQIPLFWKRMQELQHSGENELCYPVFSALGDFSAKKGLLEIAAEAYAIAYEYAPEKEDAFETLQRLLLVINSAGKTEAAADLALKTIELFKGDYASIGFKEQIAEILTDAGKYREAEDLFLNLAEHSAVTDESRIHALRRLVQLSGRISLSAATTSLLDTFFAGKKAGERKYLHAEVLLSDGKYNQAKQEFLQIASSFPDWKSRALYQAAFCCLNEKDTAGALKILSDLSKTELSEEFSAKTVFLKARALEDSGRSAEAWKAYEQYIGMKQQEDSFTVQALLRGGRLAFLTKKPEKAIEFFDTLIRKYPKDPRAADAANWKIYIYRSIGDDYQADKATYELSSSWPDAQVAFDAMYLLVENSIPTDSYTKVDQSMNALFQQAKGAENKAKVLLGRATLAVSRKKYETAGKFLAQIEADYPESKVLAEAVYLQGDIFRDSGKYRAALGAYQKVLTLNPNPYLQNATLGSAGDCFFILAGKELSTELYTEALKMYQKILKKERLETGLRAMVLYKAGRAMELSGKDDEALRYYKEALYLPSSFNGPASRLWGAKAAEAVYSIAEKRPIRQHIEDAASALKLLEQYQIIPQGTAEKRIEILKRARFRPHGKR